MAGFQLQWSIEGDKQISRVLIGMASNLRDYTQPLSQSASLLKHTFSVDVFNTQGAAIGEKWQRLSPYTVAQKARQGMPDTPLIASGNMRASFQTAVTTTQATVSNSAPYFGYHQSKEPRSKLPRRVMMKLTNDLKEQVVRYFQNYIRLSMRK